MAVYTVGRWHEGLGPDSTTDPSYIYTVTIIDQYVSSIWDIQRTNEGAFEIIAPLDAPWVDSLQLDDLVFRENCDRAMIIDKIEYSYDGSNEVRIHGLQIESILKRRIALNSHGTFPCTFGSQAAPRNFSDWIQQIITFNVGDYAGQYDTYQIPGRKIPGVYWNGHGSDPMIKASDDYLIGGSYKTDEIATFDQMTVFDVLNEIMSKNGYRWYLKPNYATTAELLGYGSFTFKIEAPKDHVNYAFRKSLGTLTSYKKIISNEGYANSAFSVGRTKKTDTAESQDVIAVTSISETSTPHDGFDKIEVMVSVSDKNDQGEEIPLANALREWLKQQAVKVLATDYVRRPDYDTEVDYKAYRDYGFEYIVGDIYHIVLDDGSEIEKRCSGIIFNEDEKGSSVYPDFEDFGIPTVDPEPSRPVMAVRSESGARLMTQSSANILMQEASSASDGLKISELPAGTELTDNDLMVYVDDNTTTRKITWSNFKAAIASVFAKKTDLNGKLDKRTESNNATYLYSHTGDTQGDVIAAFTTDNNTVARRTSTGQLRAKDPLVDQDLVTKGFATSMYAAKASTREFVKYTFFDNYDGTFELPDDVTFETLSANLQNGTDMLVKFETMMMNVYCNTYTGWEGANGYGIVFIGYGPEDAYSTNIVRYRLVVSHDPSEETTAIYKDQLSFADGNEVSY